MWAQAPDGQNAPVEGQPAAKAPDSSAQVKSNPPADAGTQHGQGVETTEFPLEKFRNFSAIQNGGPVPGLDSDVHVYRSGDLMRVEGTVKTPSYSITDLKRRKNANVNFRTCLNMSVSNVRTFPFFVPEEGNKYEIFAAGDAVVDGHHCKVEDVRIHRPKHSEVPEFRLYEADDLDGFPIKIENHRANAHHWVITYKDVHLGPQDVSLFIVPEKCESDAGWKQLGSGMKTKITPQKEPGKAPENKPSKDQQNDPQTPPKQP
jgi:hypothetical protein